MYDWLRSIGAFLGGLVASIMGLAEDHTYAAIVAILLVEEAGVPLPVPGDTIILYAGYRISQGQINPLLAALCVVGATLAGSSVLYWIARLGGHRLVFKYGKYVHLDEAKLMRMEHWFQAHQAVAIVLGRLVPGLRTAVTVVAGVFEVGFGAFLLYTGLSAMLWAGIYLGAGAILGREYENLASYAVALLGRPVVRGILAAVALALAAVWLWRRRGRRMDDQPGGPAPSVDV